MRKAMPAAMQHSASGMMVMSMCSFHLAFRICQPVTGRERTTQSDFPSMLMAEPETMFMVQSMAMAAASPNGR